MANVGLLLLWLSTKQWKVLLYELMSRNLTPPPRPFYLVIHSLDVGDVHVVGGGTNVFILLTREDVDTDQVDLHGGSTTNESGFCTSVCALSVSINLCDCVMKIKITPNHVRLITWLCSENFRTFSHTLECPTGLTDLSVAVLAGLGGGHLNDLAGSTFQHDEAVLAQGRALHGVGGRRPGITCLEVELRVCHACCGRQHSSRTFTWVHICCCEWHEHLAFIFLRDLITHRLS